VVKADFKLTFALMDYINESTHGIAKTGSREGNSSDICPLGSHP
jgi:hypothetical protein